MKLKKWKLPIQIILLLTILMLWASASWDIIYLTLNGKVNKIIMGIIHIVLIFIIIEILLRKTEPGMYIDNKIFKRNGN
ncbi:hypothetical protein GOV13_00585 [Candidatus Pacearchaeota archaeon]|nr:hypothetical protein [Candidatus Pacearchaeota archaeon]